MRKTKLLILVLAMVLVGCATMTEVITGVETKPFSELSPKQKVTFFFGQYGSELAKYNREVDLCTSQGTICSADTKKVLKAKYQILNGMYDAIQAYDLLVVQIDTTTPPTADELASKEAFLKQQLQRLILLGFSLSNQ